LFRFKSRSQAFIHATYFSYV